MLVAFMDTDRVFTKGSFMPSVSKIQEVIVSRLKSLKRLKEETAPVGHASSIGMIRELRLLNILKSLLPRGIEIQGGFICDGDGNISPQIDCIITEVDPIPCLDFDDRYKLVPVEKAIMCIEIKSTLDKTGLDQLVRQEKIINKMKRARINGNLKEVSFSLIALDTSVSKESVKSIISSNTWIRQVTVVGEYSIRNKSWGGVDVEEIDADDSYIETRKGLCWLLNIINDVIEFRSQNLPMSDRRRFWEVYLDSDVVCE